MFVRLLPVLLLAKVFAAAADPTILNTTIVIDLLFPLNQTYAPVNPFPVIFSIQNAAAAWNFGFQFQWNITGVPDEEGSGRETFGTGFLFVGQDTYHPAPSDPYIVVNSTNFPGSINGNLPLPAGHWTLAWAYQISSTCTPNAAGNLLHIEQATPVQGSMDFMVKDNGASPDFTDRNCPILAGQIGISANWTGCPQLGTPGTSNPCAAKIDTVQASSISTALALSTPTTSATRTGSGSHSSTTEGSSPTASSNSKSPNSAEKEPSQYWLLGGLAILAGFGAFLL